MSPLGTVPALAQAITRPGKHWFLYYALGLARTKEAAEVLRTELLKNPVERYRTETLTYALTLAGEPGRKVLDDLATAYPVVATYRDREYPRHWFLENGITFPPVPRVADLPSVTPLLPSMPARS